MTAYEMRISDWSSDVCSSDLEHGPLGEVERDVHGLLDDDDGGAAAVDLLHHLEELAHDRRRQTERQLVDHEQLGPGHQRPAEREHLLRSEEHRLNSSH